ncbi:MAG: carbohydrate ABC transporter permease [Actinomycetota bacterium]
MAGIDMAGQKPKGALDRFSRFFSRSAVQIVLLVVGLMWLTPTFGLLITSLRDPGDVSASGWWTVLTKPAELTVAGYQDLLDDPTIINALVNTVLITVPATLLLLAVAALAAYALAWVDFKGRDALFLIVVGLLVVPLQIALIPVAGLYNVMGIFGSIPGVVLFHLAFGMPLAVFLLRNFFIGIPAELLEAARMDGASEWRVFTRVVLPLGIPAIASLFILQFLFVWNDMLVGLVFADPQAAPLTVFIQRQTRQFGANIDIIAPASFLQMLVPLVVFFAFQRYFVQGLLAGSSK